ncbi:hypothetical protein B5X24_HaOG200521 [Helicoverpa armigera]|uniref:Peptidase S1 domain-containing protein n=1 Tax=Helicoverpa armigera TaxID=29058 RepID=A0A2W1BDR0_HELAM|nr:hypothetical protein B5X24_HaOG200521 [Helicoverpa armigera]
MKFLILFSVVVGLVAQAFGLGYHEDVGIPEAARIRQAETRQMSSRIIGGMPANYKDNPYLAGLIITLVSNQMSICSGTLVSQKKVLTAAQCWSDGYQQGRKIEVVLGETQLFYSYRREVTGISVHPGYTSKPLSNDLAMLTLRYAVNNYNYMSPVTLPFESDVNNTFAGIGAKVSGFGKTSDWSQVGPKTDQQSVIVPVIDSWYECYYGLPQRPAYNTDKILCTSGANGFGTCGGDLGGPLVAPEYFNGTDVLIGVTSIQSNMGCQNGFSTGYMRVTAYLSWIKRNL